MTDASKQWDWLERNEKRFCPDGDVDFSQEIKFKLKEKRFKKKRRKNRKHISKNEIKKKCRNLRKLWYMCLTDVRTGAQGTIKNPKCQNHK